MLATRKAVLAAAAAGLAATAAVALIPGVRFAHRNPDLHIALLTAEALIGLLAAFLVLGRFRRLQKLDDLLLCAALAVLAASNLLFAAVPAVAGSDASVFSTWSALCGRLLGTLLLAAAALAPDRRLRLSRRRLATIAGGIAGLLAVIAAAVGALDDSLPRAVDVIADPERSGSPRLEGRWPVLAAQGLALSLYAAAALGFTRRAERTDDQLLRWLAIGAVLAGVARINYLLYPSLFTEWVYTGDAFRLLFYLAVLTGATLEISSYWRAMAERAAVEERRRVARDLHDGLAQELASIRRNLQWLDADDQFVRRATDSADRALSQARRAIVVLKDHGAQPLGDALAEVARAVADREGTRVLLDVDRAPDVSPAEREALVLIASEAITNAARHGAADVVRVELSAGRPLRLRIRDRGRGFDAAAPAGEGRRGVGLASMRERAREIGAKLKISSKPGEGTDVEVIL